MSQVRLQLRSVTTAQAIAAPSRGGKLEGNWFLPFRARAPGQTGNEKAGEETSGVSQRAGFGAQDVVDWP